MLWELMRLYDWRIITYISSFPAQAGVEEEMCKGVLFSTTQHFGMLWLMVEKVTILWHMASSWLAMWINLQDCNWTVRLRRRELVPDRSWFNLLTVGQTFHADCRLNHMLVSVPAFIRLNAVETSLDYDGNVGSYRNKRTRNSDWWADIEVPS